MNVYGKPAFLACGLAALVASGTLLYLGDMRGAVAAVIIAVSALTFWRARTGDPWFRPRYWLGLALLGCDPQRLHGAFLVETRSYILSNSNRPASLPIP